MNNCEMTMKHVALGLLALTGVCAYGDSVFSDKGKDGDIANAANWSGGVMPDGSTTVVLRPDWSGVAYTQDFWIFFPDGRMKYVFAK